MPKLFIHAGAPKTGTSYLQVLFAKHASELADARVIYPRGHLFDEAAAGAITSGNGIELANYIRPELPHNIPDKEAFVNTFQNQLSQAKELGADVLYSSEFIFFNNEPRSMNLKTVAHQNGYEVKILYLVRDLGKAAFSTYSQEVKRSAETRTFAEFVHRWSPHYKHFIMTASAVFGAESLTVLNYDEHRDALSALFFRDILGTNFVPPELKHVNRSLSSKEAEYLRLMNTHFPGNRLCATFVSDALMKIDAPEESRLVLTSEEKLIIETWCGAEVSYVNQFVQGRPIRISDHVNDGRVDVRPSEFERAMLAVIAKLVETSVRKR